MIKWIFILGFCVVIAFLGSTVPIGKRTFFGHIKAIWSSPEVKDLKDGVKEKAGPTVDKIERGVKKGYDEATKDDGKHEVPADAAAH
jgi:hypothetical protein